MARTAFLGALTALVISVSSQPAWTAETVPQLDVEPSCRAAEGAAQVVGRDGNNCRSDENNAMAALGRDWDSYSSADKSHCTALVKTGGPPSYVELLSCLEVSRDARRIVQERSQRATGRGAPGGETTGTGTAPTSPPR